jgi:poly(3-hydroxybutyrate) depolymerase
MLRYALAALALIAAPAQAAALKGECPAGYQVKEGLNTDFPHAGMSRAFFVHPAKGVADPAPVWVPLTGTMESTFANLNVARSGANAQMATRGFTVVAPIRQCAKQDPNLSSGNNCNGPGSNGWNWEPWNEGRAGSPAGDRWKNDEGPDSAFFVAMLKCVATKFPLDDRRLYLGGISSGGTMTNRALTFRSDFWAGGLPISGEWYVTGDDGKGLSFDAARKVVIDNPTKIHQGRIGPYPLPRRLGPLIVITVWGGEKDLWRCAGDVLCADYRPSTQAGSNYFSSLPNVVHVACTADHGHMWPQKNTQAFNTWALNTLASHPKGSNPKRFRLTPPPEGYACKLGPYTDHY